MKLEIGSYVVDINAYDGRWHKRNNKSDTEGFLNEISMYLSDGAEKNREYGYDALAKTADKYAHDIYIALDAVGVYDREGVD